jgi:hypothetical protein
MRPVRRRLFTFCSAVSLLLCVAVCVLWVRSYFIADSWTVTRTHADGTDFGAAHHGAWSERGGFTWSVVRRGMPAEWGAQVAREMATPLTHRAHDVNSVVHFYWEPPVLGFRCFRRDDGQRLIRQITLPYFAMVLATVPLPALFLRTTLRRRSRDRAGLCRQCGYDLRASPDRCPECGAKLDVPAT